MGGVGGRKRQGRIARRWECSERVAHVQHSRRRVRDVRYKRLSTLPPLSHREHARIDSGSDRLPLRCDRCAGWSKRAPHGRLPQQSPPHGRRPQCALLRHRRPRLPPLHRLLPSLKLPLSNSSRLDQSKPRGRGRGRGRGGCRGGCRGGGAVGCVQCRLRVRRGFTQPRVLERGDLLQPMPRGV